MGMRMLLASVLDDDLARTAFIGVIRRQLWDRWHEYVRDNPKDAFRPCRIADSDTALEIWAMAANEPDWPSMVVIHPWRVARDDPLRVCLQPGPYLMARSLRGARALLPPSAAPLKGVPHSERYAEEWLV